MTGHCGDESFHAITCTGTDNKNQMQKNGQLPTQKILNNSNKMTHTSKKKILTYAYYSNY